MKQVNLNLHHQNNTHILLPWTEKMWAACFNTTAWYRSIFLLNRLISARVWHLIHFFLRGVYCSERLSRTILRNLGFKADLLLKKSGQLAALSERIEDKQKSLHKEEVVLRNDGLSRRRWRHYWKCSHKKRLLTSYGRIRFFSGKGIIYNRNPALIWSIWSLQNL